MDWGTSRRKKTERRVEGVDVRGDKKNQKGAGSVFLNHGEK